MSFTKSYYMLQAAICNYPLTTAVVISLVALAIWLIIEIKNAPEMDEFE